VMRGWPTWVTLVGMLEEMSRHAAARPVEDQRVTVVIASRNRREDLLETVGRHRAPVILVDNGSTDGSAEAVRRKHPDVQVVEAGRNLAAAGRTLGVRMASTPFVAFADDDSWWAPGALAAAAEVLAAHPRVAVVQVDVLVGEDRRRDPFCDEVARSPLPGHGTPGTAVLGFMACAAMVRREDFLRVGGFDDVVRFPGEEERLSWDLAAAGRALIYLPGPVVHHHPSPRRHDPYARQRQVSRSRVLSGVLRLPWPRVLDRAATEWRAGAARRRGVLDALPDLPRAMRRRRRLPEEVLNNISQLERRAHT
jgi:glycosyltransferase involved in cell wall biosynthesis